MAGVDRRGLVLDSGNNGRIIIISVADSGRPVLPAVFPRAELRQVPVLRQRLGGDDVVPGITLRDRHENTAGIRGVGIGGLQEAAPGRGFHQDVDHLEIFHRRRLGGDLPIAEDVDLGRGRRQERGQPVHEADGYLSLEREAVAEDPDHISPGEGTHGGLYRGQHEGGEVVDGEPVGIVSIGPGARTEDEIGSPVSGVGAAAAAAFIHFPARRNVGVLSGGHEQLALDLVFKSFEAPDGGRTHSAGQGGSVKEAAAGLEPGAYADAVAPGEIHRQVVAGELPAIEIDCPAPLREGAADIVPFSFG